MLGWRRILDGYGTRIRYHSSLYHLHHLGGKPMTEPEYVVMGEWAVRLSTGKIRHLKCRTWCIRWNEYGIPSHPCQPPHNRPLEIIPIPPMVLTVSQCLEKRRKK